MKIFTFKSLIKLSLLLMSLNSAWAQTVVYVKANATGLNNGTSWTNAYTHLVDAVNAAPINAEIWIAKGFNYNVSKTVNVTNKIVINKPLSFYGGFVGTETSKSQVIDDVSEISGEMGAIYTTTDQSDNSNSAFSIRNTTVTFNRIMFRYFFNENNNALGIIVADTNSVVNLNTCMFIENLGGINGTCVSAFKGSTVNMNAADMIDNRLSKFASLIAHSDDAIINYSNGRVLYNGSSNGGYIFYSKSTSQPSDITLAKKNLINIYNTQFTNNNMSIIYSYFGSNTIKRSKLELVTTSTQSINVNGDSTTFLLDSCLISGTINQTMLYTSGLKKASLLRNNFQYLSPEIGISSPVIYLQANHVIIDNTSFANLRGSNPIYIYANNGNVEFNKLTIEKSEVSSYILHVTAQKLTSNELILNNNKAAIGNFYNCNEVSFSNGIINEFNGGDILGIGNVSKVSFDNCNFSGIRQSEPLFRSYNNATISLTNSKIMNSFMTTNNPYSAFLFSIWNGQTYFVANCYFNNLYVYGNLIDNNGDLLMVNSELRGLVLQSNKCVFNNSKKMWVYNTNIEATFNKIFINDTSYYGKSTSIDFRLVNSIAYTFYDTVIHNKVYNPMYTEYVTNNISNKSISGPNSVSNCSVLYNSLYNPTNAVLIDKGVTPMGVTQFPIKDYFGYPRVAGSSIDIGYSEYQVTTDVQMSNISNPVEAVKMYPNPSAGSIHIQSNDDVEIQIMDQTGQVYIETQLDKGDNNIDVNQLTNGIYFIHFKNKNDIKVQKLIIQK